MAHGGDVSQQAAVLNVKNNASNADDNLCGVCKSKTVQKRVKCDNCGTFYHNSCVSKLKIKYHSPDAAIFKCCEIISEEILGETSSPDLTDHISGQGDTSFEDSFISVLNSTLDDPSKLEIKFLKAIIKSKNAIIRSMREKNELLEKLLFANTRISDSIRYVSPSGSGMTKPACHKQESTPGTTGSMSAIPDKPTHVKPRKKSNKKCNNNAEINIDDTNKTSTITTSGGKHIDEGNPVNSDVCPVVKATPAIKNRNANVKDNVAASATNEKTPRRKGDKYARTGTGTGVKTVTTVPKKAFIYVSRLAPTTSVSDVNKLVQHKCPEARTEIITSKHPEYYSSFKITVDLHNFEKAIDSDNWPSGAFVSRFFHKRTKPSDHV